MKEKILKISRLLEEGTIDENEAKQTLLNLFSNSTCKCPLCGKKMKGIEVTHYKCKKCNEYFTEEQDGLIKDWGIYDNKRKQLC